MIVGNRVQNMNSNVNFNKNKFQIKKTSKSEPLTSLDNNYYLLKIQEKVQHHQIFLKRTKKTNYINLKLIKPSNINETLFKKKTQYYQT